MAMMKILDFPVFIENVGLLLDSLLGLSELLLEL